MGGVVITGSSVGHFVATSVQRLFLFLHDSHSNSLQCVEIDCGPLWYVRGFDGGSGQVPLFVISFLSAWRKWVTVDQIFDCAVACHAT